MSEFDLHAAIKKLAEVEWPCPTLVWHESKEAVENTSKCPGQCKGTGRIVPFASLRIKCTDRHPVPRGFANDKAFGCPGWIPEPNVRVACWVVTKYLLEHECSLWLTPGGTWAVDGVLSGRTDTLVEASTAEEAILRAAEAWLKEHHRGKEW